MGSRRERLPALAWLLLLAIVPWWLGVPPLLAGAAALMVPSDRLRAHAGAIRRGLRWGLPGVLFALQRALGGDAFAWAMALLGALVGYTLLAGLEAWLDRNLREPLAPAETRDWPALALAPAGPPAAIVELDPPHWSEGRCVDPRGGEAHWADGRYRLADGNVVGGAEPRAAFSPDGRWFAAGAPRGGLILLDRGKGRRYRLHGWDLCGWHEGPWLARGTGPAMAWKEVFGQRG
ncbi:hypothetical protein [Fulvimonas yonginensis]|uniref:Uncharacterized protein n=1 Tax=Fulvimonas yonginensis TaxID=1495200 RepID=A0ABU8JBV0_9GAMM